MQVIRKILKYAGGLHYPQDFLCLAQESFAPLLRAYIVRGQRVLADVTTRHLFNGYSPVIFSFAPGTEGLGEEKAEMLLTHEPLGINDILTRRVALAGLTLQSMNVTAVPLFYECVQGWHRFMPPLAQWTGNLENWLYNRKKGNVYLAANLHTQVQVAYALPRKISLITVAAGEGYNLFPTDLHGRLDDDIYIISLRHGGMACSQVEASGRFVLSDMKAMDCKKVFALGKNHMQPGKDRTAFDFGPEASPSFRLPLPNGSVSFKELELVTAFQKGIHRVMVCRIIHASPVNPPNITLAHIHNSYATWRYKNHLAGNYIMR
jgi:Flavin reductase like domain